MKGGPFSNAMHQMGRVLEFSTILTFSCQSALSDGYGYVKELLKKREKK